MKVAKWIFATVRSGDFILLSVTQVNKIRQHFFLSIATIFFLFLSLSLFVSLRIIYISLPTHPHRANNEHHVRLMFSSILATTLQMAFARNKQNPNNVTHKWRTTKTKQKKKICFFIFKFYSIFHFHRGATETQFCLVDPFFVVVVVVSRYHLLSAHNYFH